MNVSATQFLELFKSTSWMDSVTPVDKNNEPGIITDHEDSTE